MVASILADASPQRRLFISLITRDISLADAMLDIIDNSINAALEPIASKLKTADDYEKLLADKRIKPKVQINLRIGSARIAVDDNAAGISLEMARDHVFKFGRDTPEENPSDRLSVYGIGLKRAIFKCGNKVTIISDHRSGGFELKLPDVRAWAADKSEHWTFPITARSSNSAHCGTRVMITELHDEVLRRVDDGLFLNQLRERIAKTYSAYIGRIVDITLNNSAIPQEELTIGSNHSSQKFKMGTVSCNVTAGIAQTTGERFRERNSGWYVFCNGRAVLFADTSELTGWGTGLPLFQAKHRAFLGTVFFVSPDAEALPWTTTKASINEENSVWQEARRHMVAIGRTIIRFLDSRYTSDGTELSPADLQEASGAKMSVLSAAVSGEKVFRPPTKPVPQTTSIQYRVKVSDLKKIEKHTGRQGGSDVGRYTFNYYLKNEVGDDD